MRVCFIAGEYPPMPGGVADYTRELASALWGLEVELSILTSARACGGRESDQSLSTAPDALATDPWPVNPAIERWNFRSWPLILSHLHAAQPDVVHIQYQTAAYAMHPAINLFPLWLGRRQNRPMIVTTLHDTLAPYLFPKAGRLRHKVTLAMMRGSDRTILTNEEDWARACALLQTGRPDGPISETAAPPGLRLVPIGSNIPVAPPAGFDRSWWRKRFGVLDEETLLSYFGFLNQSKGVETLLEALRILVDRRVAAKLLMVGADVGSSDPTNIVYRRRIVRQIAELGLSGHVVWTGYSTVSEVSGHLLSSDICVLPFRDGASFRRTTLIAALAHGLATVSTRARDTRPPGRAGSEMARLVHSKHALLVETDSSQRLAEAIEALTRQPEVRLALGVEGRRLVESFSWPAIAQRTLSIYEELLRR